MGVTVKWQAAYRPSFLVPVIHVVRVPAGRGKGVGREDLGHLGEGTVADIAVCGIDEGPVGFVDVRNRRLDGAQRVIPELTIREGWVAWDLNGLAARPWDE